MLQLVPKRFLLKLVPWVLASLIALFIGIQFVPYGRNRAVRSATSSFKWNAPAAEAIARTACYDCHSSETKWWWGVKLAPFSWIAQNDIEEAQRRVNFSAWNGNLTAEGLWRAIHHDMPPMKYTLFHSDAKLTEAKKLTLLQGFKTSLAFNQGDAPASAATVNPGPDATSIIYARCGLCHSPNAALRFRAASADQANAFIDRMVRQGAKVSAAERRILITHFTRA